MLREIGTVVSVVNEDMVLIRVRETLNSNATVLVFQRQLVRVVDDKSPEPVERDIVIPKGRLTVVMNEGDGLYLVERFRETVEQVQSLAKQLGFLSVRTVPGDWSAIIDQTGVHNPVRRAIQVGDLVGVGDP